VSEALLPGFRLPFFRLFLFHFLFSSMMNPYTRGQHWRSRLRQLGLAALLAGGTTAAAQAQTLTYTVGATTNTTTTYTDLAATGTAIATANTDDANSAVQNLGFSFVFNGTSFTQFVLNTNGFLKLGSTAPTGTAMFINEGGASTDPFQAANNPYIIAPLNIDLKDGSAGTAEYRVSTTGTAPNRVCTIQWKNVQDKVQVSPTQIANMSFQVRLFETTNVVELVYDAATAGTGTPTERYAQVGVKGTGFSTGQLVQMVKGAGDAWSLATPANFYSVSSSGLLNVFSIASVALPDAGRTFRFTPSLAPTNDIAARVIYTLGKVASPTALPQPVSAAITNLGTAAQTNIPVTMNVTGANTFSANATIASLAPGATAVVPLGNLPATMASGTNVFTVSVPADGDNTNNSTTTSQIVSATRLSYINPARAASGSFSVFSNSVSVLATKFTVSGTSVPTDAIISFGNTGATTAYQVLLYDANGGNGLPGKLLYSSATQNRPATGGNVTVALPAIQLPSTFYVGVREASNSGIGLATQPETPVRTGTFFYSQDGNIGWTDLAPTYAIRLGVEIGLAPTPTCATPTALAVTGTTATTATVTFTDASATGSYQLIYGPVGFQPATSGTTVTATSSPATLTNLQPGANYQLYIRSNCTGGGASFLAGPVAFSTSCNAVTSIATFPYSEGFENTATGLPCGLTVLNANNDAATWSINKTAPYAGVNAMRYTSAITNSVAADDWFFTPALTTAANTRYQVAFRYRAEGLVNSPSSYIEKLEVKVGPSATVAGQTTTLYTNANITNTSYALANATSTPAVAVFTPGAGTQYVGFHAYSDANQGNLYVDDLNISASVVTATSSAALLRAVTVFPNPSTTGTFDLEIHGANAKASLAVVVTNTLGQQVYTGTARDNYTNRLDLSTLAPGIYHLQVRNGEETMTRQLAIVK
jgi:hypothetical protein